MQSTRVKMNLECQSTCECNQSTWKCQSARSVNQPGGVSIESAARCECNRTGLSDCGAAFILSLSLISARACRLHKKRAASCKGVREPLPASGAFKAALRACTSGPKLPLGLNVVGANKREGGEGRLIGFAGTVNVVKGGAAEKEARGKTPKTRLCVAKGGGRAARGGAARILQAPCAGPLLFSARAREGPGGLGMGGQGASAKFVCVM